MVSGFVHISPTFDENSYSIEKFPQLRECVKPLMLYLAPNTVSNLASEITVVLSRLTEQLTEGAVPAVIYAGRFDFALLLGLLNCTVQLTLQPDDRLYLNITVKSAE